MDQKSQVLTIVSVSVIFGKSPTATDNFTFYDTRDAKKLFRFVEINVSPLSHLQQ